MSKELISYLEEMSMCQRWGLATVSVVKLNEAIYALKKADGHTFTDEEVEKRVKNAYDDGAEDTLRDTASYLHRIGEKFKQLYGSEEEWNNLLEKATEKE